MYITGELHRSEQWLTQRGGEGQQPVSGGGYLADDHDPNGRDVLVIIRESELQHGHRQHVGDIWRRHTRIYMCDRRWFILSVYITGELHRPEQWLAQRGGEGQQ